MIAYFDTSAVVKLLVEEDGSDVAEQVWLAADARVAATVGLVEASAAIGRAQRVGRLRAAQARRALADLTGLWAGVHRVPVDDLLATGAAELALRHGLRGYDAVHLAAAVGAADTLVAADRDLLAAARSEGLGTADVAA